MVLAICDDDALFLKKLSDTILNSNLVKDNNGEETYVIAYRHKKEIIERYVEDKVDAVFMDIEFGNDIGFDVAKELQLIDSKLLIVYMTNYDHYVYQSFVCRPMGFIRKSNMEQDVILALTQVFDEISEQNKSLTISIKGDHYDIKLSKIHAIEMQNHRMEIVMEKENIMIKISLKKVESYLSENGFLKVRRGIMVNPKFVLKIDQDGMLEMTNGRCYPISRDQIPMIRRQWLLSKVM